MPNLVPIANFEEKYQISDTGLVFNLKNNRHKTLEKLDSGYLKTTLSLNGKREQHLIHQLVARHFLPNPYNKILVNHIDGNKENNNVSNLEWATHKENTQHALELGLKKGYMSLNQKKELIQRVLNGELIRTLASEVGRREESLSGMLRRASDDLNLRSQWDAEMKRRRAIVAIRNLEKINH